MFSTNMRCVWSEFASNSKTMMYASDIVLNVPVQAEFSSNSKQFSCASETVLDVFHDIIIFGIRLSISVCTIHA